MWIIVATIVTLWLTVSVVAALFVGRMVRLRDEVEAPQVVGHGPFRGFGPNA